MSGTAPDRGAGVLRPIRPHDRIGVPESADLEAYADFARRIQLETVGTDEFSYSAAELAVLGANPYLERRRFGIFDGGRLVAATAAWWERGGNDGGAPMITMVGVDPAHRRRGLGGRVLDAVEASARDAGRGSTILISEHRTDDGAGERLRPPQGGASLPADAPSVRFARSRGYELGQLLVASALPVGGLGARFRDLSRQVDRSDGYRIELWRDRTPEEHLDAFAAARSQMVAEAPSGAVDFPDEHWDAARIIDEEARAVQAGRRHLTVAAITPDGEVAGFTILTLAPGKRGAYQDDTLVLGPHRGHGLGMRMKLANLVALADAAPERTEVYTWNADENGPMLAINRELGFRPHSIQATWQRG
ncbi:GNAT family N-acetyltransferase [Agromyces luteolus]|uniref:GNAT family N-acetyltransferase n=1 Tax=Agromyces luteolus TaxID=88373 RepID=UPI0014122809|nr:GNAT family N-acetyltransferase [Agromyces luteolus]GLK27061.1 GNAT family N-acetyltransferase [Agromyces luteolus]